MLNKREEGSIGEKLAIKFLEDKGVEILATNFRTKWAEIDIIYRDGEYLSFAEVKYRANKRYGAPYEAVTLSKRKRICSASRAFLYFNHFPESTSVRYDVISILGQEVTWFKNAFEYLN